MPPPVPSLHTRDGSENESHPSERRRRQNRQAQKDYRKRMRLIGLNAKSKTTSSTSLGIKALPSCASSTSSGGSRDIDSTSSSSSRSINFHGGLHVNSGDTDQFESTAWTQYAVRKCDLHRLSRSKFNQMMEDLERLVRRSSQLACPRADLLLTLIQFNVFRALVQNTFSMGFTMDWLKESAVSPWCTMESSGLDLASCPTSLRPTALQKIVQHHPWIDLFPLPRIRDNLLLADAYYDEDKLCNDLVEFCDVPNDCTGLIVWGEPWDPGSWEVSETFLRNWAWTIRGCSAIQLSTNHWRKQRGEAKLKFEDEQVSKPR